MSQQGKVYFVAGPGRIKVGFTTNPNERLKQLRHMDMEPLEVIGIVPGTRGGEKLLHRRFADHRLRGEWFADCAEVRDGIQEALSGNLSLEITRKNHVSLLPTAHASKRAEISVVQRASKKAEQLLAEIDRRAARKEDIKDLVRFACYLAEHVMAPIYNAENRDA